MAESPGTSHDEPLWLSASERATWIRLVSLTILLPGAVEAQLKRDAGISFFEYHVLAMLSEADGQAHLMSDLAFWTNASLSRLSHVVTRLEKQGWVRREPSTHDRRATMAVLTESGLDLLVRHAPAHVAEVRRLVFDRLSTEQVEQFGDALGAVLDAVDPDQRRADSAASDADAV